MKIEMKKFGMILVSRPAGREALLAASAYLLKPPPSGEIELDFDGVKVVGPSWLDEFLSGLKKTCPNPVKIIPTTNLSVIESLKTLSL